MKKILFTLVIAMFLLVGSVSAADEVIEFNLGHGGSMDHHYHTFATRFAELVDEKTDGAIKVTIYPADQLGGGSQMIESVKLGTQDMVIDAGPILANHEPLFGALYMPYIFDAGYEDIEKFATSDAAEYLETKLAESSNMVVLGWGENGFRLITTADIPIKKAEDMQGLKIRIGSSDIASDTYSMLGSNPTPIAMSELYSALQLGTIDAQENSIGNILRSNLQDVQDYLIISRHQHVFQPLVMNKNKFESLSAEHQEALIEAGKTAAMEDILFVKNNEEKQIEELDNLGMEVIYPDVESFQKTLEPMYANYSEEYGEEWDKLIEMIREIK